MTTCILIHNFTGSPADMEPLKAHLESAGYTVACPLLCGHAGNREELRRATTSNWVNSVEPCVKQALASGERVHLIGYSFGAMIAAIVAARQPVQSVIMLAPAVYYNLSNPLFHEMASAIKAVWNRGDSGRSYVKSRIDKVSDAPVETVKQYRRLVQMGKNALPQLTQPMCVIQGLKDEQVDPKGAEFIIQNVASADKEVHYLAESGHRLFSDPEADIVNQLVLQFIQKVDSLVKPPAL